MPALEVLAISAGKVQFLWLHTIMRGCILRLPGAVVASLGDLAKGVQKKLSDFNALPRMRALQGGQEGTLQTPRKSTGTTPAATPPRTLAQPHFEADDAVIDPTAAATILATMSAEDFGSTLVPLAKKITTRTTCCSESEAARIVPTHGARECLCGGHDGVALVDLQCIHFRS